MNPNIRENKTIFQVCINLNDDIEELKASKKRLLDLNPSWDYFCVQSQDQLDQLMVDNFQKSDDEFKNNIYKLYLEIPNLLFGSSKTLNIKDPVEKERIRLICALVSRTDIFRLGMLYKFGGLYFDLSSQLECNIASKLSDYDCAFTRSPAEVRSSFIYAKKEHFVIKKILDTAIHRGLIEKCDHQMILAGPNCITDTIQGISKNKLVECKTKIFEGQDDWAQDEVWHMDAPWKRGLHTPPPGNPNKLINNHWLFDY